MNRLLCLRLPLWPLQRRRAERPELRGVPLLLHRRDPRRGERVVACCDLARRAGVRAGMSLVEAADSLRTAAACPDEPDADVAALGRLAEHCELFSPKVGWETVAGRSAAGGVRHGKAPPWWGESPDHLFLDIAGVPHLFGGEDALAREVAESCRKLGYAGRVAVADTLGASWALAGAGGPVTVVPPGGLEPLLTPLSVESLRLPVETVQTLSRLGVRTIDQLAHLPRAGLAQRFGAPLLTRLDQAFGSAGEILIPHRPPPRFEARQVFDFPTDRRDLLDLALGALDRIAEQLQSQDRGAMRLMVELGCGPEVVTVEAPLYRPADLATPMREVLRLHLERVALPGPVDRVEVRADQTVRLRPRQAPLFADPATAGEEPLTALLDRLCGRLGARAVARPVWQADALPERAVRLVPLVGQRTPPRTPAPGGWAPAGVGHRPLRMLTPPACVEVVSPAPGDPPAAFSWQGQRHTIARSWGPERIETGWWRRRTVWRDYYRVETTAGRRFWLFLDLSDGHWYLHGTFE